MSPTLVDARRILQDHFGFSSRLNKPDGLLMALAITLSLNYANRLRLEPPAFTEIAATEWRTHMLNQKWKVSAEDLKHGR